MYLQPLREGPDVFEMLCDHARASSSIKYAFGIALENYVVMVIGFSGFWS